MGDEITQTTQSAEFLRAKYLKEALRRGSPPSLSVSQDGLMQELAPAWDVDDPVIQRAYLDQLVECAPEAITILDTCHHVTRINSEFVRMFGFTGEEVLGRPLAELVVPADRTAESDWIQEAVEKGQKIALETKRRRKDGTLVDVSVSCAPVVVGTKQVGICVLYRDIVEHKRALALSSALYRIAERTSSASHLQGFYASIHNIVDELMNARNFYIALYDPTTQLLTFPHFVDEQDPTPAPKRLGRGLTEYVLRTGEALLATPAGIRRTQGTRRSGTDRCPVPGLAGSAAPRGQPDLRRAGGTELQRSRPVY